MRDFHQQGAKAINSDNGGDFEGNVAVVTGGAGDIGSSIVANLTKQGARVAVMDTDVEKIKLVTARLERYSKRTIFLEADATNFLDVEKAIGVVVKKYGKIDILINNVGYHQFAPIYELSPDMWDMTVDVCLNSVFVCTKAVVPYMIKRKYGRIINISSVAALQGSAGYSHYAAAKAGILGFTRSLALELAG
ncbi:MAG: SDR family oxidoreductase, partial [Chloroflexi bacterium]|nr:SDR family oxidoreductase [Chloroflexota bacterium]